MNKKFFAALASATMAFTASGSIAVFADDFVEENTPSIDAGDLKPVKKEVVFDKENFGALVDKANITFTFVKGSAYNDTNLKVDEKIETKVLADVEKIEFKSNNLEGEVKGLEYFTGLKEFDDTSAKNIKNETLDFSANTKLEKLTLKHAPELAEIVLPKADEDEVYHLTSLIVEEAELSKLDLTAQEELTTLSLTKTDTTSLDLSKNAVLTNLTLNETKLTSLDLSALEELDVVKVFDNSNLKDVVLHNGRKGKPEKLTTLNLSDNALETVNLDNIEITGAKQNGLDLSGNHIGALDLSKTTVAKANVDLADQTFYVSEKAANVNLTEAFPTLKTRKVSVTPAKDFDEDTGVLTLNGEETTYKYEVSLKSGTQDMSVKITAANPMNRLYNPNSGEHFYTADVKEKEALVALGWNDEGYGWVAPKFIDEKSVTKDTDQPVYRLYNPNAGDHHYTKDAKEKETLMAYGWKYEGIGWYSAENTTDDTAKVNVYRQYNPYANGAGSHNYTTDKAENDYLVSLGWTPEGTAWYAYR